MPFENMVYLGDGETDVPCFRVMRDQGGLAVAVYGEDREGAERYLRDGRVDAVAPADYRPGGSLDRMIMAQVNLVAARARLGRTMAE